VRHRRTSERDLLRHEAPDREAQQVDLLEVHRVEKPQGTSCRLGHRVADVIA
jgi:hypothetical protein